MFSNLLRDRYIRIFLLLSLFILIGLDGQSLTINDVNVDSLRHIILCSKNDSLRAEAAVSLSWYYYKNKPDSVYYFISLVRQFADKINAAQRKYKLFSDIAYLYANIGAFGQSANFYEKALKIAYRLNDTSLLILSYGNLAQLYSLSGNYEPSKQAYKKVLSLLARVRGKSIKKQLYYYMRLGRVYYYLNNEDSAKYYLDKALTIYEQNRDSTTYSKNDIGAAYFYLGNYSRAVEYFKQAMQEDTTQLRKAIELSNIGEAYFFMGKYKQAEKYFKQVISNPEDTIYLEIMRMSYSYLAQIYEAQGRFKEAYYAHKKYNEFFQRKINAERQQTVANLELRLKLDEKSRMDSLRMAKVLELNKQELVQKELEARKQRIIILFVILILLISVIFTFLYRKRYLISKKQKEHIRLQRETLSEQKFQLELSQRKLKESVEYASRLQKALLPERSTLEKYFKDFFIFYKPLDQLSGDFYWWTEVEDNLILAVGDCTGHGVPGAMISFMGITLLNELVGDEKILDTDEILNELRKGVIKGLHQEKINYNIKDGMDIAIIKYNKRHNTIFYSGAYISLYIVRKKDKKQGLMSLDDNSLEDITIEKAKDYIIYRIRGDRMPISRYFRMQDFTEHGIKLREDDVIYLFTDGFVDQLGGEKLGKYHKKKFQHFILSMSSYSMAKQRELLAKELSDWRGEYPQVDDILVVGLKV